MVQIIIVIKYNRNNYFNNGSILIYTIYIAIPNIINVKLLSSSDKD